MTITANSQQLTLNPHQIEGVKWLLDPAHGKALVADEVGLGKTAMVIETVRRLNAQEQLRLPRAKRLARVLWLTDANLIEQTMTEFERFAPELTTLAITPEQLRRTKFTRVIQSAQFPGVDVAVMSFDTAHSRRQWVGQCQLPMLVLDEAGNLRGGGPQFNTVSSLARQTPRVIGMTATPMENHPVELYNVLAAIDVPGLWPRGTFEREFVEWRETAPDHRTKRQQKVAVAWLNDRATLRVRELLGTVMLRRTASEVSLPLPQRVGEDVIWVEPYPEQQEAYEAAARGHNAAQAFHDQQRAGVLSAGESSAIADKLIEVLAERGFPQAVIFSEYQDSLDLITERLTQAGVDTWARLDGKATAAERVERVEAFQNGDVQVLVGNIVLERGLNLQCSNLLISVGSSWNPAREAQREGRIRRAGSPHHFYEHITLAPDMPLTKAQQGRLAAKRDLAVRIGLI